MEVLVFLIPIALFLGALGLAAFIWSLKSGQFEDLDGAAMRILNDEDDQSADAPSESHASTSDRGTVKSNNS